MKKIISGKVRDVYEINDHELVIVTTDRISAFDVILPSLIPDKGKVLTKISSFWFDFTKDIVPNHMISTNQADFPEYFQANEFTDRTVLVKKLNMLPYEFIVRGYMFGNMWNAYNATKTFCGYELNETYQLGQKLKTPIVTPSIKNKEGHDEYISIQRMEDDLGKPLAGQIIALCLALYEKCYEYALQRGIIIADTKFEFGLDENGNLILADEVFTPDSSRFWSAADYVVGISPKSYDKQFLRDWLIENNFKDVTPAPMIPENIVDTTANIYKECLHKLID